jgi:hypothetical protein
MDRCGRDRWSRGDSLSTDEMGDLWIQVLPRTIDDRQRLSADYTPKALAEDASGSKGELPRPRNGLRWR